MYRLLIVDDEPYIIEGLKRLLDWEKYGFLRVETAVNYHEAIEKAIELKPDLALFDVCIDGARGYDIISRLNALHLPTAYIIISGFDEFEFVRQSFLVGVKDYLVKPIDKTRLQQLVEQVIVNDLHGSLDVANSSDGGVDPVLGVEYASLSNLTKKVLLIVQGEFHKNLSLKQIADMFKMNSTYLGQIFIKETKKRFSEYLMLYRLTVAKKRILTTSEKISSIAYGVGYSNLNYFYTQFKSCFGMSPTNLRDQNQTGRIENHET